ncbi:hypothetical protein ACT533_18490, partial [Leptospira santarosai]
SNLRFEAEFWTPCYIVLSSNYHVTLFDIAYTVLRAVSVTQKYFVFKIVILKGSDSMSFFWNGFCV